MFLYFQTYLSADFRWDRWTEFDIKQSWLTNWPEPKSSLKHFIHFGFVIISFPGHTSRFSTFYESDTEWGLEFWLVKAACHLIKWVKWCLNGSSIPQAGEEFVHFGSRAQALYYLHWWDRFTLRLQEWEWKWSSSQNQDRVSGSDARWAFYTCYDRLWRRWQISSWMEFSSKPNSTHLKETQIMRY